MWLCMHKGAVKRNTAVASASRKDVETAVAKWLTGARDRGGKRMERVKRDQLKRSAAAADLSDTDSVEH